MNFKSIATLILVSVFSPALKAEKCETPQELLIQARNTLEEAERLASRMLAQARQEVRSIKPRQNTPDLESLRQEPIAIELRNTDLHGVLAQMMPSPWRVMIDVSSDLKQHRFDFIGQKSRDELIQELTSTLGLEYSYFEKLLDGDGQPSPLLVVRQIKSRSPSSAQETF